ncbi:MAG: cyclic nucleotide-binding domain-containing protein [Rhodocyclaceae bacterium]|nr:cyclic nucleotide-binding domain-containing protein [Rhodocyclaceae bacterium]
MSQHARLLREVPIFGAIREDIIDFLLQKGREHQVRQGDWVLREGDAGGSMFVIDHGEVAVLKSHEGRQYLLNTLRDGDCIGEMALFDLMPRSASVLALSRVTLLEIDGSALHELYKRDIEQFALIQMNMGREVTRRLRECEAHIFRKLDYPEFDPGPDSSDPLTETNLEWPGRLPLHP